MIKIKTILCPTDLSEASAEALRYAVALAHTYDARLYLCYFGEAFRSPDKTISPVTLDNMRSLFTNLIVRHLGQVDLASNDRECLLI